MVKKKGCLMERRLTFHSVSLLYLLNFLSCACYPPLYTHWSFPGGTSGKLSTCQCRRHNRLEFDPWVRKIPWSRDRLPTPVFLSLPCGSDDKESTCSVGGLGSRSGSGRSSGGGHGNPLQYFCLETPMEQRCPVGT